MSSKLILTLQDVTKRFGGVLAVNRVSLEVEDNKILGLIGTNGSGKSTILRLIMGVYKPDGGSIYLRGRRIDGHKPHTIARLGIGMVHQLPRVFRSMTVIQNLRVSSRDGSIAQQSEKALTLLESFKLLRVKDEPAGSLSYGEQKLLELGRVLMFEPKLVLLDEPAAGIHPTLIGSVLDHVRQLGREGKTVIVVEHQMKVISNLCDRIVVLEHGEKIAQGTPQEVQRDQRVIDAYLGETLND